MLQGPAECDAPNIELAAIAWQLVPCQWMKHILMICHLLIQFAPYSRRTRSVCGARQVGPDPGGTAPLSAETPSCQQTFEFSKA